MIEIRSASRCRLMVLAAGIGLLAFVKVGLAQQPDKGKGADDKPPSMSYTVTKLKAGMLKVVLNHSPLGPQYSMEIDTVPKNTTPGIRNEVPVRVEYSVKDHTIAVDMLPGAKGVRTVSFDGKKVSLAKAEPPAAKAKKD